MLRSTSSFVPTACLEKELSNPDEDKTMQSDEPCSVCSQAFDMERRHTLLTAEAACPASGRGGMRAGGWWSEWPCPPVPAGVGLQPGAWLWYCPTLQTTSTELRLGLHTQAA